jgi:hypothetical protein
MKAAWWLACGYPPSSHDHDIRAGVRRLSRYTDPRSSAHDQRQSRASGGKARIRAALSI